MIVQRSLLVAALAIVPCAMFAQFARPPLYGYGVAAGLDYSLHHSFAPTPFGDNPSAINGDGIGAMGGLFVERYLNWHPERLALVLHLGYQTLPASFETASRSDYGLTPSDQTRPVDGTRKAHVSYGMVEADLQLRMPLSWIRDIGEIGVMAGPSAAYIVDESWQQTFAITDPDPLLRLRSDAGGRPDNNARTAIVAEGSVPNAEQWRIGVRGGVWLHIQTGFFRYIPTISFDYALTPVVKGSPWKAHALMLSLDVAPTPRFWQWLDGGHEYEDQMDNPL